MPPPKIQGQEGERPPGFQRTAYLSKARKVALKSTNDQHGRANVTSCNLNFSPGGVILDVVKGIIQSIFKDSFPSYLKTHQTRPEVRKAFYSLSRCRTPEMGFHFDVCPDPGHSYHEIYYNSCHHRACPSCNFLKTEQWLKQKISRMLSCNYYHVVFTVPHELIPLWQHNRNLFMILMFKASWESLKDFFLDDRYVGGLPGAIATFQSWDQRLAIHPHIHFLVTGGGVTADGSWKSTTKKNFLLPARALARKFQGKFLDYLEKGLNPARQRKKKELLVLPSEETDGCVYFRKLHSLHEKKWSNAILGPYEHGRGVALYLGRYIRGGPLKESRIRSVNKNTVIISYKRQGEFDEAENPDQKSFELPIQEFLRRFTEHIPPRGSYTSRTFGLFNPAKASLLNQVREQLGQLTLETANDEPHSHQPTRPSIRRCPICQKQLIAIYQPFKMRARAPPAIN
jgi:hypothetical protein